MIKKMIIFAVAVVALMVSGGAVLHALDRQPSKAITPEDVVRALDLKGKEAALAAREDEIVKREQLQAQIQKELDEKLARLASIQNELKDQLAAIKGAQTQEFKNLIKIYSTMSASKVAPLLDSMEDPDVVKIFRAMKADQVAKIIPKMQQDKAVAVSERLGMLSTQ